MFYFGRRYTATVRGWKRKLVTCEYCGRAYDYKVSCEATGSAESPYYLNNEGASERAQTRAQARLNSKLESAVEAVPCPQCGHFQADMVTMLRQRRFGWVNVLGWIIVGLAALLSSIPNTSDRSLSFVDRLLVRPHVFILMAGSALIALSLIGRRYLYDPNAKRSGWAAQPWKQHEHFRGSLALRWLAAAALIVAGAVAVALNEHSGWILQDGRWFAILTFVMVGAALFYPIRQWSTLDPAAADRPVSKKAPASALERDYANVFSFMDEIDRERVISSYMERRACGRDDAIAAAITDFRKDNRSWR